MQCEIEPRRPSLPETIVPPERAMPEHIRAIAETHRAAVKGLLGQGGYGEAWLVERAEAMEVLKVARSLKNPRVAAGRLRDEEMMLRSLALPGVPSVTESGEWRGTPYFFMEHINGVSLRELLRAAQGKDLPLPLLRRIIADASMLMRQLHAEGVVHGDMKLEHLLLGTRLSLIDFGLARREGTARTTMTQEGETLGTHCYLDPQMIGRAKERDRPSDIFSLGASFFELYAGHPLFTETQWQAVFRARIQVMRGKISEETYGAWHDQQIDAKMQLFEARRSRDQNLEHVVHRMIRWNGRSQENGRTVEYRRPTMEEIVTMLGAEHSAPRPYRTNDALLVSESERLAAAENILLEKQMFSRRLALILGGTLAIGGASHLLDFSDGRQNTNIGKYLPVPTIDLTNDRLLLRDPDDRLLLERSLEHCPELESATATLLIIDLTTEELCLILERMQPGLGAGMPKKEKYTGYLLRLKENPVQALLSVNRGCILFDQNGFHCYRLEQLADPSGADVAAFLDRCSSDRWASADPAVDRKYIAKASTHLRNLQKNIPHR